MIDNHNRCLGGRIWFVKDVCGIICALFTWFLIIFAQYVVITVILIPDDNLFYKTTNFIIFEFLAFLAIISHIRTMITDPVSFYVCMLFGYLYMLICCFILHSHPFHSSFTFISFLIRIHFILYSHLFHSSFTFISILFTFISILFTFISISFTLIISYSIFVCTH